MRTEERLKTIYEVLAPQIVRSEHNWRDYLSFGAKFHKHSFDNALMVYGQNPDVTMLASTPQWNNIGRYVNRGAKGIAVCVYENAKVKVSYLFDISQTNGRAVAPTNWKLDDTMKAELVNRLSYSHGYEAQDFPALLYALAGEAVAENQEHYLQDLSEDTKDHLFSELPTGGFEAQFGELLTDSVSYFIGKRCSLPDEEIRTGDGMVTINHFSTIPLIARVGNAVTTISRGILLEIERTIRIISKERKNKNEQTNDRASIHRERRDTVPQHSSVEQQRGRSAPGTVRQDGVGIPDGEPPRPLYNFENGWQSHGDHAPSSGGGGGENRNLDPAPTPKRTPAADGGHDGADEAPEQPEAASGGNRAEGAGADSPLTKPIQVNTAVPAVTTQEPSEQDGSFFVPFSPDAAKRWAQFASGPVLPLPFEEGLPTADKLADMKAWLAKHGSRFTPTYAVLYHATDRDVPVMEMGLLPTSTARRRFQQSEGGYVYLAATPERAKSFGDMGSNSDAAVYEAIVPVHKLQPDANQLFDLRSTGIQVGNSVAESIVYGGGARVKGALEQWQIRPFDYDGYLKYKAERAAQEAPDPSSMTDEEVRRHYEFILTSTELYPSELHYAMRDPDVVVRVDRDQKTVQAVSFQQDGGLPIYQEVMDYDGQVINPRGQKEINSFLTQWLSNIKWQEYEPTRAVTMKGDEEVDLSSPKAAQAVLPEQAPESPVEHPLPEPPIHLKAADPLQYLEEVTGSHHGQLDVRMQAVMDELTVGVLEYSVFENVPHIAMVEVLEAYRRQGIATGMIQKLQSQYPNTEIAWGMVTDDGAAFKAAVTYTVTNEQFERVSDDLEDISAKLRIYENDLDSGKILSRKQADDMDELSGIQYRLEQELRDLEPVQTFVRIPGENRPAPEPTPADSLEADVDGQALPYEAQPPIAPDASIQTGANFRYSPAYGLYPPGAKTKYRNNIEAIRFLKRIEKERRPATPEEQIVLARYVGWGGLANAFSEKASGWEKEYRELKLLLNDVEYRNALHSTLTAYYTEPELIKRIYTAIGSFGFHGGPNRKMLDPGMGTGNFYSVLPEEMAGTKLFGVEIDSITGRIAQQLYPEASIAVAGYQSTWFEPRSFDVILGNIPFNSIKVCDKKYKEESNWYIHDYYFGKSLDLLKPGGILAFITSQGTMDKVDDSVRQYIAARAELIGAIRLPNTAFKALAGTEVTTDILFLKKRERMVTVTNEPEFDWVNTEADRSRHWIRYNYYYQTHPEMVLGEMQQCTNQYGREDATACITPDGFNLYSALDHAIGDLQARFTAEPDPPYEEPEAGEIELVYEDAPEGTRNYTFVVQDDEIFYCEHDKLIPQPFTGKRAERIKGLCEVRAALLEVIGIQSHEYDPADLQAAQEKLNEVYDRFVKKNDAINCKGNILAFSDDDQFPLLRSIEDERKDKSGWDKSAIFYQATIHPYRVPTHVDTALEALQISLNQKLRLDFPLMCGLTGKQPDELIAELGDHIYLNPHSYYGNPLEGWELAEEYLSGFVRDKLLYAQHKAEEYPELFARNVQALEAVQPAPLTPADIEVIIGAPWIPIPFYRQFLYETFDTDTDLRVKEDSEYDEKRIDIEYVEYTTAWRISSKYAEKDSVKVNQTFGTGRKNAYEIFEDCLNMQSTTVRDPEPYVTKKGNDSVRYIVNPQETMIARAKQNQIREGFATWLWKDPQRRDALLKIYNERFNTVRPREYDGSRLVFPGMNTEMKLRKHQLDFAARVIYSGTGLAAHEVGAGKTAALIAAGMYLKNLGAIQKPVFTVPNQLVGQWAAEFYRFYPNARLLVSTEDDFTPQNRNRYISRIATGDYDAVLLAHSQFEKVPISEERQIAQLQNQIDELSFAIAQMKEEKGENWSVKQMASFQDNLQAKLQRLSAEDKKDDLLTFEQLGVDMMFVDEAHFFKNCFVYTKLRNVAGIGQSSSQRAFDMLLKCQYLQEVNDGRGVVFATGTAISI